MRETFFLNRFLTFALLIFSGCGYVLQTSGSRLANEEGIRTVFVSPVKNQTYQTGVENLVYNALVKRLSARRQFRLVHRIEESDAVLEGVVLDAAKGINGESKASDLNPKGVGSDKILVAHEYSAKLNCQFSLTRRQTGSGKSALIWSGAFSRSRLFPANNQLGALGTTSALINESEFERALSDLADNIMHDALESMTGRF